mmetsp:Transcript_15569/g.41901  ORF Transcript_15569/g.41901 Transcript_15569/m.41901 type:complete len:214 (-) Transcript_15569:3-644(-)
MVGGRSVAESVVMAASSSSGAPSFCTTKSASAHFCAMLICALIRCSASSRVKPSRLQRRSTCVSGPQFTTAVAEQTNSNARVSNKSGTSSTISVCASTKSALSIAHVMWKMTKGCIMRFSFLRAAGSAKTTLPSAARSSEPSGKNKSGPNVRRTSHSAGLCGAATSRAIASASMTGICNDRSTRDALLFPVAIPPVSPSTTGRGHEATIKVRH